MNGYQVGMVSNIDLLPNERKELLVTISINQNFEFLIIQIARYKSEI